MDSNRHARWGGLYVLMTPLEMAVKALGARYPGLVATQIGPGCRNVPAAVAALRQRMPHWFEATAADPAAGDSPVSHLLARQARH